MNGFQNGKNQNTESPFPGCLGRMVNLFDLSAGMTGNRLLTDRPHRDGECFFVHFMYRYFTFQLAVICRNVWIMILTGKYYHVLK